eukprot:1962099-Prymnesium_polylepis.1
MSASIARNRSIALRRAASLKPRRSIGSDSYFAVSSASCSQSARSRISVDWLRRRAVAYS